MTGSGETDLVCEREDGPRLDQFLSTALEGCSRTRIQSAITAGAVRVNGQTAARARHKLAPGDRITLHLPPPAVSGLEAENIPLEVLYEDAELAVLNKPAGLLVHPGAGRRTGTLVNALLYRYGTLSRPGGGAPGAEGQSEEAHAIAAARPGIVHRLDRLTSGVMVVARTDAAHLGLGEQFRNRSVRKRYLALVQGRMREPRGNIELPIGRDRRHRLRMTTRWTGAGGRAAATEYRVLESFERSGPSGRSQARPAGAVSWLEVDIHTGRTHQIRVHLAALGHPVVGDRLYGAAAQLAWGLSAARPMLHASRLEFSHPRTGERLSFSAPLPEDMRILLEALREAIIRAGSS